MYVRRAEKLVFPSSWLPIVLVIVVVMVLIALFDVVGLKVRWKIFVLATLALLWLVLAVPLGGSHPYLAEGLNIGGIVLSVVIVLYTLATARRGKQWTWFKDILFVALASVAGLILARTSLPQQDAPIAGALALAFTLAPGLCAALYGLLAPDIPKPRGSM